MFQRLRVRRHAREDVGTLRLGIPYINGFAEQIAGNREVDRTGGRRRCNFECPIEDLRYPVRSVNCFVISTRSRPAVWESRPTILVSTWVEVSTTGERSRYAS